MIYNFGKTTSSHVPILLEYINTFKPESVLEFGGGAFSTGIFNKHIKNVTTVETHYEWSQFLKNRFPSKIVYIEKTNVLHSVSHIVEKYDLVFVDTVNKLRRELVLASTKFTNTIILHDAQLPFLRKIRVVGFKRVNFKNFPHGYKNGSRPWTSIFTNDIEVYNYFSNIKESNLYKKYQFPYGLKK